MRACLFLLLSLPAAAQRLSVIETRAVDHEIRGAAVDRRTLYTWGDELRAWSIPGLRSRLLASGDFGEGGCAAGGGLVLQQGRPLGKLVWLDAARYSPVVLDDEIDMHDCLPAVLFGRRGVLMVQRGMQVRFYERDAAGRWRYREIYSFYTASYQAGLLLTDVDGDGRTDILCGNYWIRSPERFELPWRLFAINTWNETPLSAMSRFAWIAPGRLLIAQAHAGQDARVAIFEKPSDPRRLWRERRIEVTPGWRAPHALASAGGVQLVGESGGDAARVFAVSARDARQVQSRLPLLALIPAGPRLAGVGRRHLSLLRYAGTRRRPGPSPREPAKTSPAPGSLRAPRRRAARLPGSASPGPP